MQPTTRNAIAYADFILAAAVGVLALYLITMPLHTTAGDSHGGLLAVFSGFFLVPVAVMAYAAGRLTQRSSKFAWLMQVLALVLVAIPVFVLVS